MKGIQEKAIEVNNELKLIINKKQDNIKHFKEQCNIDDEDEVQETIAAITPIKKKTQCL